MPCPPIAASLAARVRARVWRRSARRSGDAAGGQALVEFALGLPLMLLIMLGTLDIGQVFIEYVSMRNAVREAASYGGRNPDDDAGIRDRYTEHSPILADDGEDIYDGGIVCLDSGGGSRSCDGLDPAMVDGTRIEVTAVRVYEPVMLGFLNSFFPKDDGGSWEILLEARATAEVLK